MRDRIDAALKAAMKDKEALRVSTLRLIRAALHEQEIAARGNEDVGDLDKAAVIQVLAKMVKQREESAKAYKEGGREELAAQELAEIKIIREFLPKPMTADEVRAAVRRAVEETGAESIKDMGKVMGVLKAQYLGRMDFALAGAEVKNALA